MRRLWIEMDGLANLRDVGGLPTTDGGTIQPRRLLRSDNLQSLSAGDIETLPRRRSLRVASGGPPGLGAGALRAVGEADGAALVHCAAGEDRTDTIVALALMTAGADRDAVIDGYAASTERMEAIVGRLRTKLRN